MDIIKQPPAIFAAFNPALLIIRDNTLDSINIRVVTYANSKSTNSDIEKDLLKTSVLYREAIFNVADIAKKGFEDSIDDEDNIIRDSNLCIQYDITFDDYFFSGYAINAVEQIGSSSNYDIQRGTFRTNFDKLIVYPGYKRTVSILTYLGGTSIFYDNVISQTILSGFPLISFILPEDKNLLTIKSALRYQTLTNNAGEDITTNEGEIIEVASASGDQEENSIPLETRCIPSSPFYVRWINQQGGWDYWMFSFRQILERNVESQQTFNPTVFDQETATSFTEEYYKEGVERITVGASGLSDNEYECISKLIYSSRIQYYDINKDKWFGLIVDAGDNEKDTRSIEKSLEFTFLLPTPQLQV